MIEIMKPIGESIGREMRWRRTRFLPAAYELRLDEQVLATLEWNGMFGSLARAQTARGSWHFRRAAPFSWARDIEDATTGTTLGRYTPRMGLGVLDLADGSSYRIGRDRLFGPLKVWREDRGLLITFSKRPVPGGGPVMLEAAASAEPRIDLLATFGFYLLTVKRRRAARSSGG